MLAGKRGWDIVSPIEITLHFWYNRGLDLEQMVYLIVLFFLKENFFGALSIPMIRHSESTSIPFPLVGWFITNQVVLLRLYAEPQGMEEERNMDGYTYSWFFTCCCFCIDVKFVIFRSMWIRALNVGTRGQRYSGSIWSSASTRLDLLCWGPSVHRRMKLTLVLHCERYDLHLLCVVEIFFLFLLLVTSCLCF